MKSFFVGCTRQPYDGLQMSWCIWVMHNQDMLESFTGTTYNRQDYSEAIRYCRRSKKKKQKGNKSAGSNK